MMRLDVENQSYDFSTHNYEDNDLETLEYTARVIEGYDDIKSALEGAGTCLDLEKDIPQREDILDVYVTIFQRHDAFNFYKVGNRGYARSIEFDHLGISGTAIDAVSSGGRAGIDPEQFRAGVTAIMKHADIQNMDLVVGGDEFFMKGYQVDLDLTRDKNRFTSARETYFDRKQDKEDTIFWDWIQSEGFEEVVDVKGEDWLLEDQFFIKEI